MSTAILLDDPLTIKVLPAGYCVYCSSQIRSPSDSDHFCFYCLGYSCFSSEAEARLAWALIRICREGIARYMDRPIPPFPGDRPTRRPSSGDSLFARVKAAVSVEELAGRFTQLEPAGPGKLKGKCPIHDERTASFYVYCDRQSWRCFGACAKGGDVISLAQELMDGGKL